MRTHGKEKGGVSMKSRERIKQALKETEVLLYPEKLISTSEPTTLHYYVLAEPFYLEAFENEGPETIIRQGKITWEKPKLLTPGYIMGLEGFSDEAKNAFGMIARDNPDLAGLLYKMKYKKEEEHSRTVPRELNDIFRKIRNKIEENEESLTVVIKGVDELWDVSLMKFIQELIVKSAYFSQIPYYTSRGYMSMDTEGNPRITRNLEGLPLVANQEIEKMFNEVKRGELDPSKLKQELDRWGVYRQYEDRFLSLFRKE